MSSIQINQDEAGRVTIRNERPADIEAIFDLTRRAFADPPYSSHTEQFIVNALRDAGALTLSLVAEDAAGRVVGHVAFSPVTISSGATDWFGLGPISVSPERQKQGIGSALIEEGLKLLRERGAQGCVLLGDPNYYGRFDFTHHPALVLPDVPAPYFLALPLLASDVPSGTVAFHPAFSATE